jgi:hypothetical protein
LKLIKSSIIYSYPNAEGGRDHYLEYSSGSPQIALRDDTLQWAIANLTGESGECNPTPLTEGAFSDAIATTDDSAQSGYHLGTRDHPFLDMSSGIAARIQDASIMSGYVDANGAPDLGLNIDSRESIEIEDAKDLNIDALRNSTKYQFDLILSGTFGVRGKQPQYYDSETGYHQVPLLRKSIPSGGARHPSECFFEVVKSPVMSRGLYYFSPVKSRAFLVRPRSSDDIAGDLQVMSDASWLIKIYICSAVRQAMFRYRDPRSFRAILVDIGHAEGQLSALASFNNWRYSSALDVNFNFLQFDVEDASEDGLPIISSGLLEGWE